MNAQRPTLGRRLLAGAIDLYNFCYVALLPLVIMGAIVIFREERVIRREVARARAMPKGVWKLDPAREAALQKARWELLRRLGDDLGSETTQFLDSLAPRLDEDQRFKDTLDRLIKHPYTELASETAQRGIAALKRHVRTPEGARALARMEKFVGEDSLRRLAAHLREELDYRIGQIADYLGFHWLGERIRALMRTGPQAPGPSEVPEALHWTNLLDKILEEKLEILPETRTNLGLLKLAAFAAMALGLLYLALRDIVGRGRSFGKRAAGLVVVDHRSGAPASARQLATRGVLLVLLFPLELLLAVADRRIGDRIAGTRLVAER